MNKTIHEQSKQLTLGLGSQDIRSLFKVHAGDIGPLTNDIIQDNYNRLVKWIKSHEVHVTEEVEAFFERWHLLEKQMAKLDEKIESLLNQLHSSRVGKIWRGIPIPQVTTILKKNRQIRDLIAEAPIDSITGDTGLLLPKNKKPIEKDRVQEILDYTPVFDAFAGDMENPELMVRVAAPGPHPVAIKDNKRLCFSICCAHNDFFCIKIMLATYVRVNTCDLRVFIFKEDENHDRHRLAPVFSCEFNAIDVLDNQYYPISFPPIGDSRGNVYRIEIDSPNATEDQHIAVWCHPADSKLMTDARMISGSKLLINDEQHERFPLSFLDTQAALYPWMRRLLSGIPLKQFMDKKTDKQHKRVDHALWIYNNKIDHSGFLPAALLLFFQMAEQVGRSVSVSVYGVHDPAIETYCELNSIEYHVMPKSVIQECKVLPWALQQARENIVSPDGFIWFFQSGMRPGKDLIKNAETMFRHYPETGILLPVVENHEKKVSHSFGQITREGHIHTFPVGMSVTHPLNSCARNVDATDSPFFIIRNRVLTEFFYNTSFYGNSLDGNSLDGNSLDGNSLDGNSLDGNSFDGNSFDGYYTAPYQMTELIWQLKKRDYKVRFDPRISFAGDRFKDEIPEDIVDMLTLSSSDEKLSVEVVDADQYEEPHQEIREHFDDQDGDKEDRFDEPYEWVIDHDRISFLKRWRKELFYKPAAYDDISVLLNPDRQTTALVIDLTLPTFDEDSGSLRMFEILKMLVELGIRVTFFPDNLDCTPKYRRALEFMGIEVFCGDYGIADALAGRQYDIIMLSRVDIGHRYMNIVKLLNPNARIYYDTVDIHYVREFRQAEIELDDNMRRRAVKTRQKELANAVMSDVVFTVTEDDKKHLLKEIPSLDCFVLPNIHRKLPFDISWEDTDGLVFIGNYNHPPNEDAVFYFVENVLPLVQKKIPDICLYLVGSYMKDAMKALASESIKAVGWVEDVEPELVKRRVMVSYLRYGAGMKGKIGQAMSLGLPVVSTTIGAEGMGLKDQENVMVADDPEVFAEKICQLYSDKKVWEAISGNSRKYIYSRYGIDVIKEKLKNFLDEDLKNSVVSQICGPLSGNTYQ
ncbi:putative Glycosyltransferase [Desulfamplus magnetovallimortis]|uniref:Putative Glycosyltransferase n=1 Tax=Desulfamplus magnetovallimortis TaxID=1246637 RepID=A0A1W1HBZ1_9BACT|nr:putative Glycosyltransferase [Desulfamplus magnetovallimortis]